MAIPTSGPLTLTDIQTEFGGSSPTSLNEYYAGGAYVAAGTSGTYGAVPSSGEISLRNFYGTTAAPIAVTSINLRAYALANGWDEVSAYTATFGDNITIYSTSTSVGGLTIDGTWPNGVTVISSGKIMGMGGSGVNGVGGNGENGGPAIVLGPVLSVPSAVIIINSGNIGGGGGGGGGYLGGGGAGGGPGGGLNNSIGGVGGAPGQPGTNGTGPVNPGGGGGGRIFPGTGGVGRAIGGGAGGSGSYQSGASGQVGNGGSAGNVGTNGVASSFNYIGGGGGGWGAAGGYGGYHGANQGSGGAGGKAVQLNGYSVAITNTGAIYGLVS